MKYGQKNIVITLLIILLSFALASCSPGQTGSAPQVTETTAPVANATSSAQVQSTADTTTETATEMTAETTIETTTELTTKTTAEITTETTMPATTAPSTEPIGLDETTVRWLQEQLKIAGYYTLINGVYSADCQAQLDAFCCDQLGQTYPNYNGVIEAALIDYNRNRMAGDIDDYLVYATKDINFRSTDVPSRLVDLAVNHIVAEGVEQIEEKTNQQLVKMFDAAAVEGITLRVVSAYRSFEYQIRLFNRRVVKYGFDNANYSTAIPGQSEHQTGLVVDVDDGTWDHTVKQSFDQTAAYQWLDAHAHEYGFILSYPKDKEDITGYMYEPWHYRFVGSPEVATEIKQRAITLEQYVKEKQDNQ